MGGSRALPVGRKEVDTSGPAFTSLQVRKGFPGNSAGKEYACNVGELSSIPGLGRPLEEGMTTHSSILAWRIPMDRGTWQTIVHGIEKSQP